MRVSVGSQNTEVPSFISQCPNFGRILSIPPEVSEISPPWLAGLPLILYNKTTATRASLDHFFDQAGITPTVLMEVDREDTILALVRSGLGATILPRCFLNTQHLDNSLRFLRLRNAYLRRQVGIAVTGNRECSELVDLAIRLCKQHFHGAIAS
jgi:DNA-binding transcriptional LysR family regulator